MVKQARTMIISPATKIWHAPNLLDGAESLPRNKIAAFNYERDAHGSWYENNINARLSRLLLDIPDGVDRVEIVGVEGTIADAIDYRAWGTSTAIILYKGVPVAMSYRSGAAYPRTILYSDISGLKDLKGKKLLAILDMWFNTDVSQHEEKEHKGTFRVNYYAGGNIVETQEIDLALYSPGALINSTIVETYGEHYIKITLDEQTINRIDFIHVSATYNQPFAGKLLHAVELDESGEVVRHTMSASGHIKIIPRRSTRTIYITSQPYTYPDYDLPAYFHVSIYARYVPGLPSA
jgi:hypothetical protein